MATAATNGFAAYATTDDVIQAGRALHDKLLAEVKEAVAQADAARTAQVLASVEARITALVQAEMSKCFEEFQAQSEKRVEEWRRMCALWMEQVRELLNSLPPPQVTVEVQAPPPRLVKKVFTYDQYGRPETVVERDVKEG